MTPDVFGQALCVKGTASSVRRLGKGCDVIFFMGNTSLI